MNQVKRLDLRCSELCLLHDYGWLQARISRLVSRTGDGPLYLLLALALLGWDSDRGREFLYTGLLAFATLGFSLVVVPAAWMAGVGYAAYMASDEHGHHPWLHVWEYHWRAWLERLRKS